MKLLTIAVPSYNSQDYLERCVSSLLVAGEQIEIIIIDDGSTDNTAAMADAYREQYPSVIKVIHQPNGGHGDAVTTGIKYATGEFFKVVDSDDFLGKTALLTLLDLLSSFVKKKQPIDLVVSNYIYNKEGKKTPKVIKFHSVLPENRPFSWDDTRRFKKGQYLLMHSLLYRTKLLQDIHFSLPKHTFYVDNLFAYIPLQYVNTLYYCNVDLYYYNIGREDQSVQENIMIERIDQQLSVNKAVFDSIDLDEISTPKQKQYLLHYLEIITTVSSILLIKSGRKENLEKKEELWNYFKQEKESTYRKLRYGLLGIGVNLPTRAGRATSLFFYWMAQKLFGFN